MKHPNCNGAKKTLGKNLIRFQDERQILRLRMALVCVPEKVISSQQNLSRERELTFLSLTEFDGMIEMIFWYLENIGDGVALLSTCKTLWNHDNLRYYLRDWKIESFQMATEEWKEETESNYRGGTGTFIRYSHYAKKSAWKEYGLKFTDYYWTDKDSYKYEPKPLEDVGDLEYGEIFA